MRAIRLGRIGPPILSRVQIFATRNKHNKDMKRIIIPIACAAFASFAMAADVTETKTTTTTYGTGTIAEYQPDTTFVVKETSGPVTYKYGKKVTYVTKKGTALSADEVRTRIKVGVPVRVQYATEGDARIINRVEIEED
jgi:hypothetical protein